MISSRSLRFRLSFGLLAVTIGVALLGGAGAFAQTYRHILANLDEQLRRTCALVDLQGVRARELVPQEDSQAFVRVIAPGEAGKARSLPRSCLREGFRTVRRDGGQWRIFVRVRTDGMAIVAGQSMAQRDSIARRSAMKTVLPMLLLMPLLLLAIRIVIGRSFRPLLELSEEIGDRDPERLHPLAASLAPTEIRPFVEAINGLLARAGEAMARQRRFVADVAHELRTPLTALSLRAQRLGKAEMTAAAREEFLRLAEGIERTQRTVEQLLDLARTQDGPPDGPVASLEEVVVSTVEDLLPLSLARRIDLGIAALEGSGPRAPEAWLRAVTRNLVENALRHIPEGGRVDIALRKNPAGWALQVEDDGPGLPPEDRARAFDAFHRGANRQTSGAGLGLAIVRTVCERLGARARLEASETGGLRAVVVFPG